MKRSLRIKALIIFLAWGVVFLHGVVPHIHMNEQHNRCHSLLHEQDPAERGNNIADHSKGVQTDHAKVCHFSTIMFQQQGFDELLTGTSQKPHIIPVVQILSLIITDQDNFHSLSEQGPSLLRAPPVA